VKFACQRLCFKSSSHARPELELCGFCSTRSLRLLVNNQPAQVRAAIENHSTHNLVKSSLTPWASLMTRLVVSATSGGGGFRMKLRPASLVECTPMLSVVPEKPTVYSQGGKIPQSANATKPQQIMSLCILIGRSEIHRFSVFPRASSSKSTHTPFARNTARDPSISRPLSSFSKASVIANLARETCEIRATIA